MNSIHTASIASSEMSDLDGYSIPGDYTYNMQSQYGAVNEDFGFDPPSTTMFTKAEPFSPPPSADPMQLSSWPGFEQTNQKGMNEHLAPTPPDDVSPDFDSIKQITMEQPLSNTGAAITRYGQVTPPRSNSTISDDNKKQSADVEVIKASAERRKKSSKSSVKEESESAQPTTVGRKRKNNRKSSAAKEEQDDKRRQSLEKNRLAAAKCRVNKKEKTEQLQRNSHEKAVHNAFLKEQVMRMKEEVQQMNALLLAHASCDGCKSPEEIQKHLASLGNGFFAQQISPMNYDYSEVSLEEMSSLVQDANMSTDYFNSVSVNSNMLNPPLPDFDRAAEFEVHTPMQAD